MTLPQDPFMLLSFINMKLRDNDYKDLDDLCEELGCKSDEIKEKLEEAGFEYLPEIKQFR